MGKRGAPVGNWFANQLYNTSVVWLLGILVLGVIFYTTTNSQLATHDKRFDSIEQLLKDQATKTQEQKKSEAAEREKIRSDFIADSKSTALGIAELNKQIAIMSTVLGNMKDELVKINTRPDAAIKR